jgi:flagellar biosynthetic protein FlhB
MAEEQGEEKTEEPTSKRLNEARERGELPRSPDFGGALEVLVICALLFLLGGGIVESLSAMLKSSLTFSDLTVDAERDLPLLLGQRVIEGGGLAGSYGQWRIFVFLQGGGSEV